MAKRIKWWAPEQPPLPAYLKDYKGPLGTEGITFADRAFWWLPEHMDDADYERFVRSRYHVADCWLNALYAHDHGDPAPLAALLAKGPAPAAVQPLLDDLAEREKKRGIRRRPPVPLYDLSMADQALELAKAEVRNRVEIEKRKRAKKGAALNVEKHTKTLVQEISAERGIPNKRLWGHVRGKTGSSIRMRRRLPRLSD